MLVLPFDLELNVGTRTLSQMQALLYNQLQNRLIMQSSNPVVNPVNFQVFNSLADVVGVAFLAGMAGQFVASLFCQFVYVGKEVRGKADFRSSQAKAHDLIFERLGLFLDLKGLLDWVVPNETKD